MTNLKLSSSSSNNKTTNSGYNFLPNEITIQAIKRLKEYKTPPDPYGFPTGRAAVMVALFYSRSGDLNVILTTRSKSMRTYAGNVALPGGKADETDLNLEFTARREALEEIGLPMDETKVEYLTTLSPFASRSMLLVSPVICLIKDYTIQPLLNPTEVDQIFSFPLKAFLQLNHPPAKLSSSSTSLNKLTNSNFKEQPFHTHYDYSWYGNELYRFHSFNTLPVPITGLTADILINVAITTYGHLPTYNHKAPNQLSSKSLIEKALLDPNWNLRAQEGVVAAARVKQAEEDWKKKEKEEEEKKKMKKGKL